VLIVSHDMLGLRRIQQAPLAQQAIYFALIQR
jgi:hypothetical protein